jgi:hypothetical protein
MRRRGAHIDVKLAMADARSLRLIGLVFGAITAAVLITALTVATHAVLDSGAYQIASETRTHSVQ